MPTRCVKYAGNHLTNTCRCCNCDEDHPADSIIYAVYEERLAQVQQQRSERAAKTRRYVLAPAPRTNARERSGQLPAASVLTVNTVAQYSNLPELSRLYARWAAPSMAEISGK